MSAPNGCPNCDAEWRAVELVGAAKRGGGYHCRCHVCGHEWDDAHATHGERHDARIADAAAAARGEG